MDIRDLMERQDKAKAESKVGLYMIGFILFWVMLAIMGGWNPFSS